MSETLRYAEEGEVHLDFHGATNTTIDFIIARYGIAALDEIFRKVGRDVYRSIHEDLVAGDTRQLVEHWRHFFTREDCDYDIAIGRDEIVLTEAGFARLAEALADGSTASSQAAGRR